MNIKEKRAVQDLEKISTGIKKCIIPAALITFIHFSWQLHRAPWPDINIMGNL